jgi:DNA-binding response OmpR family regulator
MKITHSQLLDKTLDLSVMFVEDHAPFLEEMREVLEDLFGEVHCFDNGRDAITYYRTAVENGKKIDMVLTDIMLPGLDGVSLVRQIRETEKDQCIVVLSAYTETEDLITLINQGVDYFMRKPIDYDEMIEVFYDVGFRFSKKAVECSRESGKALLSEGYVWDIKRRILLYENKEVVLGANEMLFMEYLIEHSGEIFSSESLSFWFAQQEIEISPKGIRNLVMQIRQKTHYGLIQNIYGAGYRIIAEV